jgi:hypothetical protein
MQDVTNALRILVGKSERKRPHCGTYAKPGI